MVGGRELAGDGLKKACRAEPGGHTRRAGFSGGAILLCAVSALCVTALCLMALSRASASQRMARRAADEAAGYYAACMAADADIAAERAAGHASAVPFEGDYAISDTQSLHVEAEIGPGKAYRILEWRAVPVSDWAPDTGLGVAQ